MSLGGSSSRGWLGATFVVLAVSFVVLIVAVGIPRPEPEATPTPGPTRVPILPPTTPPDWPRHSGGGLMIGLPPAWLVATVSQQPSQAAIDDALEPLRSYLLMMRQHVAGGAYNVVAYDPATIDEDVPVATGIEAVRAPGVAGTRAFDDLVGAQARRLQAEYILDAPPTSRRIDLAGFEAAEFQFRAKDAPIPMAPVEVVYVVYLIRAEADLIHVTFSSMPTVAAESLVTFRQIVASLQVSRLPAPS